MEAVKEPASRGERRARLLEAAVLLAAALGFAWSCLIFHPEPRGG